MATRHPERYSAMLEKLRSAREAAGLTQVDVAKRLGEPQQYVSKIELNERRIDPVELQELAELYGKDIAWFVITADESEEQEKGDS
ncbi:MAG: helix-turn-helix transcriptional regulator [Acidobacteriota bacterium]